MELNENRWIAGRRRGCGRNRLEYKGKPLSIGFNARYLIDVLGVLGGDGEIDIELKDELSPSIIRKAGVDSYLYVLMPMRL